jgi:sulfotransferase family protein
LPNFRFEKALGKARDAKQRLSGVGHNTPEVEQYREQAGDPEKNARRRVPEQKEKIKSKRQELRRIKSERRAVKGWEDQTGHIKRVKRIQQEIFQLENELNAATFQANEPQTGALPDFAVIGATKCGTTFFYHLLTRHPLVEPAGFKELHFFDILFDEGIEWYRRCFPTPRLEDCRRTITGEATPGYLFHPHAPERMAEVIPRARLIALLRNPVDRTYSAYHHRVRNAQETRTFEEAVARALQADEARPLGEESETSVHEDRASPDDSRYGFLLNSIYVDHLLRWSEFFPKEQMLVLKSEDFFERPKETLKVVVDFLDLPDWEPGASELDHKLNKGGYELGMGPAIRRRLDEYFESHNRRLYDFLGTDFGW